MKWVLLSLSLVCVQHVLMESNNVCTTFDDYYNDLENNPNCSYNPDIDLSIPEIIRHHGYPVENYTVVTQDGYILTIFRIPHGKGSSKQKIGPPIFMQHGISTSSVVFVDIGNLSLAFVLADSGYDIWLGNFRGTEYSNTHVLLNNTDKRYWNYSFHELGIYDLPAELDFVANKTQQKVYYIGYSMGTASFYVYSSKYPNKAKSTIKIAISLAPIGFLHYVTTPVKVLTEPIIYNAIRKLLYGITNGVVQIRTPEFIATLKMLCLPYPIQMNICLFPSYLLFGFDYPQQNPMTLPITLIQNKDAVTLKTVDHFVQLIQSGRFQQFDYGKIKNKELYGSVAPPQYNLSNINVPNYFIRGDSDPIATKKNVEETYAALPKRAKPFNIYRIKYKKFTHADFDLAKDVKKLAYDHIVKFLAKYGKNFN